MFASVPPWRSSVRLVRVHRVGVSSSEFGVSSQGALYACRRRVPPVRSRNSSRRVQVTERIQPSGRCSSSSSSFDHPRRDVRRTAIDRPEACSAASKSRTCGVEPSRRYAAASGGDTGRRSERRRARPSAVNASTTARTNAGGQDSGTSHDGHERGVGESFERFARPAASPCQRAAALHVVADDLARRREAAARPAPARRRPPPGTTTSPTGPARRAATSTRRRTAGSHAFGAAHPRRQSAAQHDAAAVHQGLVPGRIVPPGRGDETEYPPGGARIAPGRSHWFGFGSFTPCVETNEIYNNDDRLGCDPTSPRCRPVRPTRRGVVTCRSRPGRARRPAPGRVP